MYHLDMYMCMSTHKHKHKSTLHLQHLTVEIEGWSSLNRNDGVCPPPGETEMIVLAMLDKISGY